MKLSNLPIGRNAVITKVGGEGALRCRLLDMGIIPKTRIVIRSVAPLGDPIEIRIRDYTLTLRMEDAEKIEVDPIEGEAL
ncbi:ferrous iron transport protein A/ferrous iron transport protein B [Ruminiclostridium sufflavum DSM 19573]|uniref:Ferrous iron transport protein A/ferrous iron transport protein B n=1 Tax=Ruminiclostridium sufflavum DSM 19573 TaxID=1121337 RepID=A0A318XPH4_9FIRM|nr:FeoA family protein [Ruminiclostridium sufflavum]PYG89058.1 ferrous iron transport protein A/ferrous iron transport protein B [Ruminiclostridium sufflavum DSM 19573]